MQKRIYSFSVIIIILLLRIDLTLAQSISKNVVICNNDQCPMVPSLLDNQEKLSNQVIVFQTSDHPEFMSRSIKFFSNAHKNQWQHIYINQNTLEDNHPIIGFGGAFTDSTAILYKNMSIQLQQKLIDSYFSKNGIEFSLGRVPMASSDFSCRTLAPYNQAKPSLGNCSNKLTLYSYADQPSKDLANFNLQTEDLDFKIPMIIAAKTATDNNDGTLKLFASPWSAPAWMKTNHHMVHGSLSLAYYQLWADYFVKFLQAYKEKQIYFWGVTVQNEPVKGSVLNSLVQTWQSMFYTNQQEGHFIRYYLGPTLEKYEHDYGAKINIIMHDDQVVTIKDRVNILNDANVAKYIAGAGLHWYQSADLLYRNLDKTFYILNSDNKSANRFILATEACEGYLPFTRGPLLGNWQRGEAYAHDIINDLNHHVSGWTDWNMLLDMHGGPNWAKNYVDAPILFDIKTQSFYKQPMYYYLGHFSKFIRPGAQLIKSLSMGPAPLEEVAFKVPARSDIPATIVIVVLNRDITARDYYIEDNTRYINMHIPAHAIQTVIYRAI